MSAGFFAEHTVAGLFGPLREGTVTPRLLVGRALEAAAGLGAALGAFVTLDEAGALASARVAGQELAAGHDRGPLHGIPVAVKDMVDTAGLRTTAGSRHFADRIPERDAWCVRRLRAAGAVIIGKTATHEFAFGPTGDRSLSGPVRNPHRGDRMAGGSSGGSAAAVAAGIVPVAVGTDTGGSVRIPAACCGVVGLRPTWGAVPTEGVLPLAPSLDTVGALARTVPDCALAYRVLTDGAPAGAPADGASLGSAPAEAPPRIGWVPPDLLHPVARAVVEAAHAAAGRLAASAGGLSEVLIPDGDRLHWAYRVIQGREAYAVHAGRVADAPELFDPEVLERLRDAARVTEREYADARRYAAGAVDEIAARCAGVDLLALPTIPIVAPPLNARRWHADRAPVDSRAALLSLTSPWSVLGWPALSVPVGTVEGLPVGLQLVGRPRAEPLLLAAALRVATDQAAPR